MVNTCSQIHAHKDIFDNSFGTIVFNVITISYNKLNFSFEFQNLNSFCGALYQPQIHRMGFSKEYV